MNQDSIVSLIVGALIGGVIGFFFSSLTSVIGFLFQLFRDKEDKKWELERARQEEAKRLIGIRLEHLEKEVSNIFDYLSSGYSILEHTMSVNQDIQAFLEFKKAYLLPIFNSRARLMSNAFYFNDEALYSIFFDIFELVKGLLDRYDDLSIAVKEKNVEAIRQIKEKLPELLAEITGVFSSFYQRIDVIYSNSLLEFNDIRGSVDLDTKLRRMREKTKDTERKGSEGRDHPTNSSPSESHDSEDMTT